MKSILLYGSSLLTEKTASFLLQHQKEDFRLVGYIPSVQPTLKGTVHLEEFGINHKPPHDFGLNIGYEDLIEDWEAVFNIHPGLLPQYGGVDILHHTIVNQERVQGFTLQKMREKRDVGPILAQTTYPVLENDTVISLYQKNLVRYPCFALYCIYILMELDLETIKQMPNIVPHIYKRGRVDSRHKQMYQQNLIELKKFEKANHE